MYGASISPSDIYLAPPLDLPLVFWGFDKNDGRMGAQRRSKNIEKPDGTGKYDQVRYHEGVDLKCHKAGVDVYAAEEGYVVAVDKEENSDLKWIAIDHQPRGLGLLSKYLHLEETHVKVDTSANPKRIKQGECIGTIGKHEAGPHLHFGLRRVAPSTTRPTADIGSHPIDPLPALYRWDALYHRTMRKRSRRTVDELSVVRYDFAQMPFFQVKAGDELFVLPLFDVGPTEEAIMALLRDAYSAGKKVRLRTRPTSFFKEPGHEIIVGVKV